ncbi:MAG: PAS domain S-box protein [Sphingobium sp.]|nr:PAS domain S-box protein [Sphingobium sp.]
MLTGQQDLLTEIIPLSALLACCVGLAVFAHREALQRVRTEERVGARARAISDFRRLADSASEFAICMLDKAGMVVHWSKGAENLTGRPECDALAQGLEIFYASQDIATGRPQADLEAARRLGRYSDERLCARVDGETFLGTISLTRICDDQGDMLGFGVSLQDISSERALYRRIHTQEAQLRSVLSAVPEAMVAVDKQGVVQMFSAHAEQMFGYGEDEVVGQAPDVLFALPWSKRVTHYLQSRQNGSVCKPMRLIAVHRNGALFPVEATFGIADTASGRWITAFLRDLTEQEETRAKMEALQMDLLHGSRLGAMGIMASTLAHELNQPMTAMTNYLEGCRAQLSRMQGEPIKKLDEILARVSSEAVRAGRIIGHIREFVARGETTLSIENGNEIVTSAGTLIAGAAKQENVTIDYVLDDVGSVFVDRVQVHQVLVNLINNAIDAMREGTCASRRITVSTHVQDEEFVRVAVQDRAGGLLPEVRDRLFQAFTSAGKETGLGLGLSICRTIVEAHGGRIWAESLEDGGTRFNFTLCRFAGELSHAA